MYLITQRLNGLQRNCLLQTFFMFEVITMMTNLIECHIQAYFNQGNLPKMHKFYEELFMDVKKQLWGCIPTWRNAPLTISANFFGDGRNFLTQASYYEFQNLDFLAFQSSKQMIHSKKLNSYFQEMKSFQISKFPRLNFSNSSSEFKQLMFRNQISASPI